MIKLLSIVAIVLSFVAFAVLHGSGRTGLDE